jgi:hypothetical protein
VPERCEHELDHGAKDHSTGVDWRKETYPLNPRTILSEALFEATLTGHRVQCRTMSMAAGGIRLTTTQRIMLIK